MAANIDFRRNRDPWLLHIVRTCLGDNTIVTGLAAYGILAIGVALGEAWNDAACTIGPCPLLLPEGLTRTDRLEDVFREVAGFMLGVQTGLLGVLSIAVALVTLIGQRDHAEDDVRVYYHESFAAPLAGSSLALLAVLLGQLFWPLELFAPNTVAPSVNMTAEAVLTGVHVIWLLANIFLYVRFVLISLSFGQERQRTRFRARYTAKVSAPHNIFRGILRTRYLLAPTEFPLPFRGAVSMGPHYIEPPLEGVVLNLQRRSRLHDVWLGPVGFVAARRHRRAAIEGTLPAMSFMVDFDRAFEGRVVLCRVHEGGQLSFLERQLIRAAFRFRRAP